VRSFRDNGVNHEINRPKGLQDVRGLGQWEIEMASLGRFDREVNIVVFGISVFGSIRNQPRAADADQRGAHRAIRYQTQQRHVGKYGLCPLAGERGLFMGRRTKEPAIDKDSNGIGEFQRHGRLSILSLGKIACQSDIALVVFESYPWALLFRRERRRI
jgi:hypothetical protein